MPADPDDLFDSFRDQLTGPGARSHSAPPAPGPEHVGRLVVRCPGCGEERWYGYGQCSRCGAPGPAVEVGGVVELDPLRWLVVDPVPDSPVLPNDPLAHLDPRAGHEAAVARQDPKESKWARDPTLWARERLGVHLWSKQRDLLLSLRDHHQTAVYTAHNIGKSFSAAVAALWWIDTHRVGEAFVVTTAPSSAQVRAILWREIGRHHARAQLQGRVNLTSEWYVGSELVAMGRKPPDYKEDAFQGIHARYVLVIFDEATGVPRLLWDAASTLTSNDESRFLAIGNPDDRHTAFGDACEDPTLEQDWNRIQISAHDTPNFTGEPVTEHVAASLVTPRWAEQRKRLWGEHSSIYQSKVLGRFPQDVDDGAVPYSWAQACRALELVDEEPVCAGLDVAGTGQDRTVLRERRGRRAGRERVWQEESDTVALATDIALSLREWGAKRIVVDAEGVGHGMVSELQRLSTRHRADLTVAMHDAEVVAFRAAGRPTLTADGIKFLNLRAQLYWVARELSRLKLWDLGAVDDDDVLAELCAPRYEVVPASGKIKVEAKKEVKKRLGVSPDRAEALLLAFWEAHGEAHLPAGARVLTGTSYATERQPLTLPGDREPATPRDPADVEREAELVRELLLDRSLT